LDRNFSAWIGLVPKQHSSGGRDKLGSISKRGDRYSQPVHRWRAGRHPLCQDPWHETSALAHDVVGAAAHEGRRGRARQQDRKNGMGHDRQGRTLKEPVALAA